MNDKMNESKAKNDGSIKAFLIVLVFILALGVGLSLGFYLGMVSVVNVLTDLSENTTIVIDFDEEMAMNYAVKFLREEYGDLFDAAILGDDLQVNMSEDEKIKVIADKTRELFKEAQEHPEQRDVSQTVQNFVPEDLE